MLINMLKKLLNRCLSVSIEQQIIADQAKVKERLEAEIKRSEPVEIDPRDTGSPLGEYGYRVRGPEPTRYGDWERKGRVTDF